YDAYAGVEVIFLPIRRYVEARPADPVTQYPRPREQDDEWVRLPPKETRHPGLTIREARECSSLLDQGEINASTSGGKPCTYPTWEHERPRFLLTTEFFYKQY